ncbi:hypothetical protein [Acetobacter malorum]|uniref:hypothetical protein n=1 Tax=Acetobacter malorum TaxID=178901 RepID=UPI0039EA9DE5
MKYAHGLTSEGRQSVMHPFGELAYVVTEPLFIQRWADCSVPYSNGAGVRTTGAGG